jgi:hypothetical protein
MQSVSGGYKSNTFRNLSGVVGCLLGSCSVGGGDASDNVIVLASAEPPDAGEARPPSVTGSRLVPGSCPRPSATTGSPLGNRSMPANPMLRPGWSLGRAAHPPNAFGQPTFAPVRALVSIGDPESSPPGSSFASSRTVSESSSMPGTCFFHFFLMVEERQYLVPSFPPHPFPPPPRTRYTALFRSRVLVRLVGFFKDYGFLMFRYSCRRRIATRISPFVHHWSWSD